MPREAACTSRTSFAKCAQIAKIWGSVSRVAARRHVIVEDAHWLLASTGQLHGTTAELRRFGSGHQGLLSETILASEQVSELAEQAPILLIRPY